MHQRQYQILNGNIRRMAMAPFRWVNHQNNRAIPPAGHNQNQQVQNNHQQVANNHQQLKNQNNQVKNQNHHINHAVADQNQPAADLSPTPRQNETDKLNRRKSRADFETGENPNNENFCKDLLQAVHDDTDARHESLLQCEIDMYTSDYNRLMDLVPEEYLPKNPLQYRYYAKGLHAILFLRSTSPRTPYSTYTMPRGLHAQLKCLIKVREKMMNNMSISRSNSNRPITLMSPSNK